ncbi:PAS domain-containing sensor histidine kinase [Lysinibacillus sp. BW-2-10]|uniref:PAS domain-containing sensor histidine kinase n=1 Tax=Lysinibacillus sp. BW-2-10 TaxID=2590030 RepID=UPI00117C3722|nr:PAS domain-containing sensor histidine kinase [Lysinibacillus sp. BW-2-10]TSI05090.1 PAS domain S-box protein [Lysinibacillus sp. BW-2-10]
MEKTNHMNWEFETITKHTQDILIVVDQNQIVQFITPSFETVLGYRIEELLGRNVFDPVFPEDRDRLIASHREVINLKEPKMDEYRVYHKNGEVKYVESRVMLIPNDPNNLVVVNIRDITLRKSMEAELANRKNRYQVLQNQLKKYSQDLSMVLKLSDLKNRLIKELETVLPEAQPLISIFHRETESFEGDFPIGLLSYLPTLAIGKIQYDNEQIHILLGERKEKAHILTINACSIKESMDLIWFETLIFYTVMVFESLHVIENLINQLESALQNNKRPQWMMRLLFNLSEKQRLELSSDLHDTVLHEQMILYRNLDAILKEYNFEGEIQDQLNGIVKGVSDSIHQIQMTCHELRPPLLRELGLLSSLENLFEYMQVSSTFKINYTTENTEALVLNEEETIGLYRIVQELLNNAGKHSRASNLYFHIENKENNIMLQYSDDGIGFDSEKLTPTYKSIGLSGMRERIKSLGGTIEFDTQPGEGLRVRLELPITR